jgi:inner membrane protein
VLAICFTGLILLIDRVLVPVTNSTAEFGVLDEPAHLSTCVLLLMLVVLIGLRPSWTFLACALLASVAIDLDHVPAYLGWHGLSEGTPRPYTHGLLTIVVFAVAALATPRRWSQAFAGLAFGVGAHLVRDVATGPGISPYWPIAKTTVQAPYLPYASLMVAIACLVLGTWHRIHERPETTSHR